MKAFLDFRKGGSNLEQANYCIMVVSLDDWNCAFCLLGTIYQLLAMLENTKCYSLLMWLSIFIFLSIHPKAMNFLPVQVYPTVWHFSTFSIQWMGQKVHFVSLCFCAIQVDNNILITLPDFCAQITLCSLCRLGPQSMGWQHPCLGWAFSPQASVEIPLQTYIQVCGSKCHQIDT